MTLPAATADLKDWVADRRKFLSVQYDDWMQVIGDFRDSVSTTGPKLGAIVTSFTTQIDSLLQGLFSSTPAADGSSSYDIDATVRGDVLQQLELLESELATEAAVVAAWRDLVKSAHMPVAWLRRSRFGVTRYLPLRSAETWTWLVALAHSRA